MLATALTFVGLMVFQWGMDITGRTASADLGSVGGTAVSIEEYQAVYRNLYDQIQSSQELPISSQQNREIEDMAWNEVVTQILVRNELARRGIRVSDEEIRQAALYAPPPDLRSEPAFLSDTGEFDLQKYQQYLNQAGQDPLFLLQLEQYYREAIPREKLVRQVTSGIYVSDPELWERWRAANEWVEVTYLSVNPAELADASVNVAAQEVEAYYRDNPEEFEVPARASVRFTFVDKAPLSTDSLAALQHAQAIREEIIGGADFAAVAARESADANTAQTGGGLGRVRPGDLLGEMDAAISSLPIGEISQPIRTLAGYHLLEVTSREGDQSDVRHILVPLHRTAESELALLVLADSLETLGQARTVVSAAAQLGLEVLEGQITEDFAFLPGVGSAGEAQDWIFIDQEGVGAVSPVFETQTAFYMVEIVSVSPSGSRSLEEASADIERHLRQERKTAQVLEDAAGWSQELRSGTTTLERLAERLALETRQAGPFTRDEFVPGLGLRTAAIGAAFGAAVGQIAGPVVALDQVILLRVEARREADREEWETQKTGLRAQVTQEIQQARLSEWLEGLRATARIVDNRDAYFRMAEEQAESAAQLPPVF
jgi:peptidyl-prolyl cis-trans isomerase D